MRSKGMMRLAACAMAVCMTIAAAGCGRNVDYSIGDESSQTGEAESSSDENANSNEAENTQEELDAETGGTLAEQLGIPEACNVEFDTGDSGLTSITCKADEISLPEGDRTQKAVYEVYDCDTETLTQICNALLDADKGVTAREDGVYTKAEIEADIESAKEALQRAEASGYEELVENRYGHLYQLYE